MLYCVVHQWISVFSYLVTLSSLILMESIPIPVLNLYYMMSSCNATLSLEQTRMWIVCWYDWFSHYTYNMSQTTVICCTVFSFGDSRMLWCIILYVSPTTNYHSPTQRFPFSPICKHWNHANSLLHTNIPNHQFDRIIQQPNI